MDSEEDVRLTSFRPLSPDNSKSSFSLARFFHRKRHGARVEVKVDASKSQRPVSPRNSPQLQTRAKSPEPLQRSWAASPLIHRRSSAQAGSSVPPRRASAGHRNVHAVLGRLNAAADGRGQVSTCWQKKKIWVGNLKCFQEMLLLMARLVFHTLECKNTDLVKSQHRNIWQNCEWHQGKILLNSLMPYIK